MIDWLTSGLSPDWSGRAVSQTQGRTMIVLSSHCFEAKYGLSYENRFPMMHQLSSDNKLL